MTRTKKLRLLEEFIKQGRGDECVVEYQDALKFQFEGKRIGDECIRETYTIQQLHEKIENNDVEDIVFSFKELFKNIDRNKITRLQIVYKDTVDTYEEMYKKRMEKNVGDIYSNYQKENNGE